MVVELVGVEAAEIGVAHEAPALRAEVVPCEVGEGPCLPEPVPYALALDGLLPHTGGDLGYVDEGPLASCEHHRAEVVVVVQVLLCDGARHVPRLVERHHHLALEGVP